MKSQLRRYTRLGAAIPVENAHIYETGGLSINDDLKEVRVDGDVVKLTPIEYNILFLLMKNQGKVFSINQIYESIWNEEAIAAVDNHVDQIGTSVANAVIDLIEEKEIPMNIEVPYDLEEGTSL